MNPDALTDEMQALRRLLGDAPVVTPDSLTVGLGWLLATLKASLGKGEGGEVYQELGNGVASGHYLWREAGAS